MAETALCINFCVLFFVPLKQLRPRAGRLAGLRPARPQLRWGAPPAAGKRPAALLYLFRAEKGLVFKAQKAS